MFRKNPALHKGAKFEDGRGCCKGKCNYGIEGRKHKGVKTIKAAESQIEELGITEDWYDLPEPIETVADPVRLAYFKQANDIIAQRNEGFSILSDIHIS